MEHVILLQNPNNNHKHKHKHNDDFDKDTHYSSPSPIPTSHLPSDATYRLYHPIHHHSGVLMVFPTYSLIHFPPQIIAITMTILTTTPLTYFLPTFRMIIRNNSQQVQWYTYLHLPLDKWISQPLSNNGMLLHPFGTRTIMVIIMVMVMVMVVVTTRMVMMMMMMEQRTSRRMMIMRKKYPLWKRNHNYLHSRFWNNQIIRHGSNSLRILISIFQSPQAQIQAQVQVQPQVQAQAPGNKMQTKKYTWPFHWHSRLYLGMNLGRMK
mmetsp:Transcript_22095/g.31083  ORF Transcript_22095/g.31083 Transcript_22095/m.31083 type:complete len:265 (+) Transcript_22095:356-1150(+)